MSRTLTLVGPLAVVLLALPVGCTRDEAPPKAEAPSKPVAQIAATPMAKPPVGETEDDPEYPEELEELYVDLEGDPDEGAPPLTVKWTSIVEDGTEPYTYKWEFGDGTPVSADANPTHVYKEAGDYTATLTVKDAKGLWGSEEYDVLVESE